MKTACRTIVFFAVILLLVFSSIVIAEDTENRKKILYFSLSSGFEHTTVKSQDGKPSVSDLAIIKVCKPKGIEVVCTKDGSVFEGDLSSYGAFIFQTSGELVRGTEANPEWALTPRGWSNLLKEIRGGKCLLAFHPTTDSNRADGPHYVNTYVNSPEETVTEFTRVLGAAFTIHGPQQQVAIRVVEPSPFAWLTGKGKSFRMFDEWYVHKNFNKDIHVFAILETEGMEGEMYNRPPLPIVWGRSENKGRVLYSAFGHLDEYWQDDDNMSFVLELIQCALGEKKVDLTPNMHEVTPGATILLHPEGKK